MPRSAVVCLSAGSACLQKHHTHKGSYKGLCPTTNATIPVLVEWNDLIPSASLYQLDMWGLGRRAVPGNTVRLGTIIAAFIAVTVAAREVMLKV